MSQASQVAEDASIKAGKEDRDLTLVNFYYPSLYKIKLTVNHTKPNFTGEAVIGLERNDLFSGDEPRHFELRLHKLSLVILKAELKTDSSSHRLKVETNGKDQVIFSSEEDLDLPQAFSVLVSYMGKINTIKTYKDQTHGLFKTNYSDAISGAANNFILATHTQPHSAREIFPLIEEQYKKAPIELTIVTNSRFKVASNAPFARDPEQISLSEDSIFEFRRTPPISPSVFGFIIGDMEYIESKSSSIPTRVFTTIGSSAHARYALSMLETFLPTLEKTLGVKYPLDKIDMIGIPFFSDGVMENWGLIMTQEQLILADPEHDNTEKLKQMQQMISHELVHQWLGNLVTFESWRSLWLNEAIATWLGNYIVHISEVNPKYKYDIETIDEVEEIMDKDCYYYDDAPGLDSIHHSTLLIKNTMDETTQTLFNESNYKKGIAFMRMVSYILNNEHDASVETSPCDSLMFKGLRTFLEKFKYKSVKELELWNVLNEFTSCELPKLLYSWTRQSGYPLLDVSHSDGKLIFQQQRFLNNALYSELDIENQPYHIPLLIRASGKEGNIKDVNLILSDRRTSIDLQLDSLVAVNHEKGGYYRTVYSIEVLSSICSRIKRNQLTRLDLISLINDYGKMIESYGSDSSMLTSFITIAEVFIEKDWKVDFEVLSVLLSYLEVINLTLMHFSPYDKFGKWIDNFIIALHDKVGGWNKLASLTSNYDPSEMRTRGLILQVGVRNPKFQTLGRTLFKNFLSSGLNKAFTPKELLSPVFNLTIVGATAKEYKKVFEFVKNSNSSQLKNTNASQTELQTVAVSSLTFTDNHELLSKSLNFVMTNIDSKLIELTLIGFQYKFDKRFKLMLFNWYKLHYDQWTFKSLRKGSDWAAQLSKTLNNISKIIFGDLMQYDSDLVALKATFVEEKLKKLPEHGLTTLVEQIDLENHEKYKRGAFYNALESNY